MDKLHYFASNRILAQKKKTTTEMKIFFKKCRFAGLNDGIWPKNDEPLTGSYLLTHFKSKSCTNLSETKFWHKKKRAPKRKFIKKCHFEHQNDWIWLKNDDSTGESFPLTNFQSKSCTNLPQTEFWRKKKTTTETKILKKMPFRRPKRWNLAKKGWTSSGVLSVDPFPIEKLHQF